MFRRFLIAGLLFAPLFSLAYTSPGNPNGFVNDFAQILRPDTVTALNQKLTNFSQTTGNEIVVVTIPNLGDETIETYATKLFEEWKIGKAKEDNGLLLLISRDNREMRIEVGYGLEPVITDIESGHIIRDVLTSAFQAGDYDTGVEKAIARLTTDITNGAPQNTEPVSPKVDWGNLIAPGLFALMFLSSILARSKSWWAGGVIGAIFGLVLSSWMWTIVFIIVGLIFDYIVSKTYQSSKANGVNPPWWIGGPGSGKGGGGFGGFGGGMSGGGGASGRW